MGRKAKCKICGKEIDTATAFFVMTGNKVQRKNYYCSEEEYNQAQEAKKQKKQQENKMRNKFMEDCFFEFDLYMSLDTKKEKDTIEQVIKRLLKTYSETQISWVLETYLGKFFELAERKDIKKDLYKLKYVLVILENNFQKAIDKMPTPRTAVETDYYMPGFNKYKPRPYHRSGAEIEHLGEEDDSE